MNNNQELILRNGDSLPVDRLSTLIQSSMESQGLDIANPGGTRTNWLVKRGKIVDDMANGAVAWNNAVTGITPLVDNPAMARTDFGCDNAVSFSCTAGFSRLRRTLITPTIFTGVLEFWIHLSCDPYSATSLSVLVSKDNLTTSITMPFVGAFFMRAGWNKLTWHITEDGTTKPNGDPAVITGATTFADTMTHCQIQFGGYQTPNSAGLVPVITLGGIFYGGESKASVLLSWDDSTSDQYSIFKLFQAKGLVGTMSIIPQVIANGGGLSLAQLQEMYDADWDLVSHTMHSTAGNLINDSDDVVFYKISAARDWMIAHGFTRTANVLVWPENAYNDRITAIAASAGVRLMLGSANPVMPTNKGIDNPYRMGRLPTGNKTLAQVKKYLDMAEKYKGLVIITGHTIVGTDTVPAAESTPPVDGIGWNRSDYLALAEEIAARIEAGTLQNINYSDILANCFLKNGQ